MTGGFTTFYYNTMRDVSELPPGYQRQQTGLLLVGHGTRDAAGLAEFWQIAALLKRRLAGKYVVEPCFLELAEPAIETAVRVLAERDVQKLIVAPLLLFAAGHAKHDIPNAVRTATALVSAATGHKFAEVAQTAALECDDALVRLSAQRYAEAIAGRPEVSPQDTLLVLIGRGSSDGDALAAMHRFAHARLAATPVGRVDVGFAAVAKPSLEEALAAAGSSPFCRIVVQPHLLFAGRVLDQIRGALSAAAINSPEKEWLLASHLGPSELLVDGLEELVCRVETADEKHT